MRLLRTVLITTMLVTGGAVTTTAPASALSCTPSVPRATCTVYQVNRISTVPHVRGALVDGCYIARAGSTCTVGVGKSYTITGTVGVDFGLSQSWVRGSLGISASTTSTVSTTCQSPSTLPAGTYYPVYEDFTRYTYTISKYTRGPGGTGLTTSGVKTTRIPSGLRCGG